MFLYVTGCPVLTLLPFPQTRVKGPPKTTLVLKRRNAIDAIFGTYL